MTRRSSVTSSCDSGRAERGVQPGGIRRGRAVQGQGHQDGALALDEVVAGRLAGGGRVSEDAEQVVAQLEGLAEREPEGAEDAQLLLAASCQRRADVQRSLDGVLRGLVAQHGHGGIDVGHAPGLHRDVEELAGDHLGAAAVEDVERGHDPVARQTAVPQQLVGPAQQQVTQQDRGGRAVLLRVAPPAVPPVLGREAAVGRRPAAPGVGGVHVVVVHQGAGVQQLQRRAHARTSRRLVRASYAAAGHGR